MLQINNIDYVEFYVGNASQAAHFYRMAFGFTPIAFSSLETGERDRTSFVLQQNNITLIFTSALMPGSPVAEHVRVHGDSIKDIAFNVDDARYTFKRRCGAARVPCWSRPSSSRRIASSRRPSPPTAIPSTPSSSERGSTNGSSPVISRSKILRR